MASLTHACHVYDRQISSLRSMSSRRTSAMLKYPGLVPALVFVVNIFACGFVEPRLLEDNNSAGTFFLLETGVFASVLMLHGSSNLREILTRSLLMGVPGRKRFLFTLLEFGTQPIGVAMAASLLLAWTILFYAHPGMLGLIWLATLIWWGSVTLITAIIFLFAHQRSLHPFVIVGGIALLVFVVLSGPSVLTGETPILDLPVSGWTGRSFFAALTGDAATSLFWLAPSLFLAVVSLLLGMRKR
ncbi:MAG: hypothetical protein WB699_09610 [Bacteroidota bacterium]